jgi:hypothetical protein
MQPASRSQQITATDATACHKSEQSASDQLMGLFTDQQPMQLTSSQQPMQPASRSQQLTQRTPPQHYMQLASMQPMQRASMQAALSPQHMTKISIDTLSCSLQCSSSLSGGAVNALSHHCSSSGGAAYNTTVILEEALSRPAILIAAHKSAPVASKFAGSARTGTQRCQVDLSRPNIDSCASNSSASMTQGGECGNYAHLPATYGPYSNHDNSISATLINHNARSTHAQFDQLAKLGRAIYMHEANAGLIALSLPLLVTHQAFKSAALTATLKPAIFPAAFRPAFAAHEPAMQQMTAVLMTQAIDYMAYTGCNYNSISLSTICHIAYWFYTQFRMTTESCYLAALALPITQHFNQHLTHATLQVSQQSEPLAHAATNDDVQPSLVLIFATTIVMVHKTTVSSYCRNKNATHRVKSLHSHLYG